MLYMFSYHAYNEPSLLPISLFYAHNQGKHFPHFHRILCLDSQSMKIKAPGTMEGNGISALKLNRSGSILLVFLAKCYNRNTRSARAYKVRP